MMSWKAGCGVAMAGVMLVAKPAVDLLLTPELPGTVHPVTALLGTGLMAFSTSFRWS
jgi:hypothetical protein